MEDFNNNDESIILTLDPWRKSLPNRCFNVGGRGFRWLVVGGVGNKDRLIANWELVLVK